MFNRFIVAFGFILGVILAVLAVLGICAVSWLLVCGLVWFVAWCFGLTFSWGIATGVWAIAVVCTLVFGK